MSKLNGTSLVGGSVNFKRVDNDFYATDPKSVLSLLEVEDFNNGIILEPCCGQGHISKTLEKHTNSKVISRDLIDRGYGEGGQDFLLFQEPNQCDYIITNPPYSLAKEFVEQSLKVATKKVAMFLKIQFLEGQSRKEWFKTTPLKTVYVFSKRQKSLRNGETINPKTGKSWSNTMCFCWFVWEKGYEGKPQIEWV
jgi:adenine-specific DNA methylase